MERESMSLRKWLEMMGIATGAAVIASALPSSAVVFAQDGFSRVTPDASGNIPIGDSNIAPEGPNILGGDPGLEVSGRPVVYGLSALIVFGALGALLSLNKK